jgi:hypothetical protein
MNTTWPKIEVEYANPTRKREIISLEEAAKRFLLDDRELGWLTRGEIAGTGVKEPHVHAIHRYTLEDSIRAASKDLLEACEWLYDALQEAADPLCGDVRTEYRKKLETAIKKARGLS